MTVDSERNEKMGQKNKKQRISRSVANLFSAAKEAQTKCCWLICDRKDLEYVFENNLLKGRNMLKCTKKKKPTLQRRWDY